MGLWKEMLKNGLDRKSTIVALGGGVTGDLAGFCRIHVHARDELGGRADDLARDGRFVLGRQDGIRFARRQEPNWLFSFAEIGFGRSALAEDFTGTELISGMAEVVKHGIISDPNCFICAGAGWLGSKRILKKL